jgi:hypothetical protein
VFLVRNLRRIDSDHADGQLYTARGYNDGVAIDNAGDLVIRNETVGGGDKQEGKKLQ